MKKRFVLLSLVSLIILLFPGFTSHANPAETIGEFDGKTTASQNEIAEEIDVLGEPDNKTIIFQTEMTEEEIDKEHERQLKEHLSSLKMLNTEYRMIRGTRTTRSVAGYAGKQPSKGTRFPTGGGFYHSTSGGPTATLSVSFPSPFSNFRLAVPLGNSASSGIYVSVPNRTNYFKLRVQKTYSVEPFYMERKVWDDRCFCNKWEFWYASHTSTHTHTSAWAARVN